MVRGKRWRLYQNLTYLNGAGKSRFYVKPNLLLASDDPNKGTSYVITDPSGELLESCGTFLKQKGYKIRVLNLTDMEHSSCYNPFDYINTEEDVLILINCLIKNTTPAGKGGGDPFWEKSETALLSALFFFLWKHRPEEERNFTSVMKLLRAANIDENDSSTESPLDKIFNEIGQNDPNDMGYKSYQTFRMGAGKTLKSILISAAVRLNSFEIPAVANMVTHDYLHPEKNLDLRQVGMEKTALFCIIPSADDTYNFIVAMMYYQLFSTLYYTYDHDKKQLNYPVRFMLDEFANIGQIPDFDKKLATMRKYKISCAIILQNLKQLEEMYDKKAEPLIGNCDTILFLGSSEASTLEYVSKKLGTTTVKVKNYSKSRGTTGSSSESENSTKRELMTPDEVGLMNTNDCILFLRGEKPFYGPKYKYEKHPNFKYTKDADESLKYDLPTEFEKSMAGLEDEEEVVIDSESMANTRPLASAKLENNKPRKLFSTETIAKAKALFKKEASKNVFEMLDNAEAIVDEVSETEEFEEMATVEEEPTTIKESNTIIEETPSAVEGTDPGFNTLSSIDDEEPEFDDDSEDDDEIVTSDSDFDEEMTSVPPVSSINIEEQLNNIEENSINEASTSPVKVDIIDDDEYNFPSKEEKVETQEVKETPTFNPFASRMEAMGVKTTDSKETSNILSGDIEDDDDDSSTKIDSSKNAEARLLSTKEIEIAKAEFDDEYESTNFQGNTDDDF